MRQDRNIEWVIGIDLGHGETSAAICPMQWDTPESQLERPTDLEIGANSKVIPSVMTIMANGDAYIGESAFKHDNLEGAQFFAYFKKRPVDANGKDEKIMIRFMHEVYKLICEKNSDKLTKGNHVVAIATPSGWDKKAQDVYKTMAEKAGIPIEFVTKESRAAFVRAQHDATSGLSRSIDKGAVVFDMGSSTLDFTFMNRSKSSDLIDHGYDCGASYVEKMMFHNLESSKPVIKEFENKYPKLTATLLYKTREIKEHFYFDPKSKVKKIINLDEFVDDEDFEEPIKIKYEPGELDEELDEAGYIGQIRDAMIDFQSNYLNGAKIYGVLMTGGASRMDFMKDLIAECWNVDPSQIYRDQDPSLTISQGVAEVARIDMLTGGMDESLESEFAKYRDGKVIAETFMKGFEGILNEQIHQNVKNMMVYFRNSTENHSLNDLQNGISNSVDSAISDLTDNLEGAIQGCIEDETKELREKVDNVVAYYSSQGVNIKVPEINISNLDGLDGIDFDNVIASISNQINEQSDGWSDFITGAAIGGVVAFLLSGPLGWLAGGAYVAYKLLFGEEETEEQKRQKAMAKELNQEERINVFNALESKWDEISANISSSVHSALSGRSNISANVRKIASSVVKQYEKSLKDARVLID